MNFDFFLYYLGPIGLIMAGFLVRYSKNEQLKKMRLTLIVLGVILLFIKLLR